ncbi:hypothetical protein KW795_02555, partial [Candidatus Microgenomates bacterium]|nr:hypothetical protein [Candidatus Microgenomates bacterium]
MEFLKSTVLNYFINKELDERERNITNKCRKFWKLNFGIDNENTITPNTWEYEEVAQKVNELLPKYELAYDLYRNEIVELLIEGMQALVHGESLDEVSERMGMTRKDSVRWFECLQPIMG